MIEMKVSDLEGEWLDYFAGVALTGKYPGNDVFGGTRVFMEYDIVGIEIERSESLDVFSPSELWRHGGPLIERERIDLEFSHMETLDWTATHPCGADGMPKNGHGETPLIAAMRAFVRAKLGEEVTPHGKVS